MAAILIRDVPEELHRRLQDEAKRHRRSMSKQALILLERGMKSQPPGLPPPLKLATPVTQAMIDMAKRQGRE